MNYYPFHIGDYISDTAHLTPMEDLVYRRLIDLYYLTEEPLYHDPVKLARLIRLKDHQKEIETILSEFFTVDEDGVCKHTRCESELEKYQHKKDSAINANKIRWGSVRESESDKNGNTDQIPTNTNTNTKTNTNKKNKDSILFSLIKRKVEEQVAKDWIKLRNTQKAPVTNTVIRTFVLEADKAKLSLNEVLIICIEKSWRGFKADWLINLDGNGEDKPTGPDWRYDKNLIKEKGVDLGIPMNQGEDMKEYRTRLIMVYGDKP